MTRLLRRTGIGGVLLLLAGAACNDGTGPGGSSIVSVDETVTGSVDGPGQIVTFEIDGFVGQTLRAFFQATSGDGRDSLALQVLSPEDGALVARVTSAGTQPTLEQRATAVFTLPFTARYRIEVRGVDTGTDQGPFRFRIAQIDMVPEVAPRALVIGSTVTGESIATPGDVDDFTFEGAAGDELAAFIQGMDGAAADSLTLFVYSPQITSFFQRVAHTPGTADSLRAHGTGRFVLPAAGTYVARVLGRRVSVTMRYQLQLIRIARTPERAAEAIAIGMIVHESIDYMGDIDDFYVDAAEGDRLTFRFERLSGVRGFAPYLVELRGPAGNLIVSQLEWPGDPNAWTSGAYTTDPLPAGRYRYRVVPDANGRDPEPGPYRFLVERAAP